MKKKLHYTKSRGQSIPLLALMLVVLFGMAALALDVGNTYAQQREVVRAANSAALEAMDAVNDKLTDRKIYERVYNSLVSQGMNIVETVTGPDQMTFEAYYFDANGKRLCQVGFCDNFDRRQVSYVRVSVDGKVGAYFAQLAGRPDLPVNAVAHASSSICTDGMYPIAIDKNLIDENKNTWQQPDKTYRDEIYKGVWVKRISMRDVNTPGNFGYMTWTNLPKDGSAPWLRGALTPPAKVANYQEAVWPRTGTDLVEPDGYPIMPNQMNKGDWIAGNSGLSNTVKDELNYLISKRVILNLPLYDDVAGNGSGSAYHLYGVGKFMLIEYGHNSKDGWYMDLVYISEGEECVGLMSGTSVPPTMAGMTLEGDVALYPHSYLIPQNANTPLQLLIVLDVSGSMNYNFDGYAYKDGASYRCQGPGAKECLGENVWNVAEERRINTAVRVLKEMVVNKLRPDDQVRIITYHGTYGQYPDAIVPGLDKVVTGLSTVAPNAWTSDRATILNALDKVLDPSFVKVQGETPSAVGLARALQEYNSSPVNVPGTNKPYKRSIIFMTDGLANVTRTGKWYRCEGTTAGTYSVDSVDCLSGRNDLDGMLNPTTDYPIIAMNKEAFALHNLIKGEDKGNGSLNVVAMGPIGDVVGDSLSQVTSTGTVATAADESKLRAELEAIFSAVTNLPCTDTIDRSSPTTVIEPANLPTGVGSLPDGVVGYVKLTSTNWESDPAPIIWNTTTKKLSYRIEGIPPGDYNMTYWMMYRGDDGVVRSYEVATPFGQPSGLPLASQSISLKPSTDVIGSVVKNLIMDLETGIDVCANVNPAP